jgi:heavy metal translocating P-type ATPase
MSKYKLWLTVITGLIALGLAFIGQQPFAAQVLVTVVSTVLVLILIKDMLQTLRSGQYGVDLLAILAIVTTLLIGEYWAGLMILLMLTGGDSLEEYATHKAGQSLEALLANSPQTAHLQTETGLVDQPATAVVVGAQLVVKPGELVPVDGKIIRGSSQFNQATLTGESEPVTKTVGEDVLSGAINENTAITMVATATAANSQYQALVKLVQKAQSEPAQFVRLADRYAAPFTAIAILIAAAAWWLSGDVTRFAEVLVVASPCPLILAAPIALVAGMNRASQRGIIIKNGTIIEKLAQAETAAFDKTGTLTQGHLTLDQVVPYGELTAGQLQQLAASLEQHSNHILARSLVATVDSAQLLVATDVSEITGQGVQGQIDGQLVKVGKPSFVQLPADAPQPAQTAIYVQATNTYLGYLTFTDQLRPEAPTALAQLRQLGFQKLVMLTGDRQAVAEEIGGSLALDAIQGDCRPETKMIALHDLQKIAPVVMVGDGVNDAPALATADVGVAMGAHGATAASEAADVVILKDDLQRIPQAVAISQTTMHLAKQTVIIGMIVLVVLMLIATTGVLPALFGAMLQEVVDTLTILLALRVRWAHTRF